MAAYQYLSIRGLRVVSAARFIEEAEAKANRLKTGSSLRRSPNVKPGVVDTVPDEQLYNPQLLKIRLERFLERYPAGFNNEEFRREERYYKDAAASLQKATIGDERLAALMTQGDYKQAASLIRANYQKDNLLYKPWEVLPFVNTPDLTLVEGLYQLLYFEGNDPTFSTRFEKWVKPLAQTNPLCWPAATYHLMLHDPTRHIFVKPGTVGKFMRTVGSGLVWQPRTNAAFYTQIQRFALALLEALKPTGACDLIDVQSFIWVLRDLE